MWMLGLRLETPALSPWLRPVHGDSEASSIRSKPGHVIALCARTQEKLLGLHSALC